MSKRTVAALLAGIGLGVLVAGIAILVWWTTFERDRPMQVVGEAQRLEALLEDAPYITLYEGERPVTLIAPRSAYGLEQWLREDAAELAAMGREVRLIMVPSGHGGTGEEATIAEIWLRRDIDLLRQWFSMRAEHWTGVGVERANASSARMEALAKAEGFKRTLMATITRNGEDTRWPVVVWRDGGGNLAMCLCNTAEAVQQARQTLGLTSMVATNEAYDPSYYEGDPDYGGTDYGYDAYGPNGYRQDGYQRDGDRDRERDEDGRHSDERSRDRDRDDDDDDDDRRDSHYPRLTVPEEYDRRDEHWGQDSETQRPRPTTPSPRLPGDVTPQTPQRPRAAPPAAAPAPSQQAPAQRAPSPRETNKAQPKAQKDAESLFY